MLDNGCNALNVFGTTGEATSFALGDRLALMSAAALGAAIALTRHAADLGFAGALVLPPFYYKGVSEDGVFAYLSAMAQPMPPLTAWAKAEAHDLAVSLDAARG